MLCRRCKVLYKDSGNHKAFWVFLNIRVEDPLEDTVHLTFKDTSFFEYEPTGNYLILEKDDLVIERELVSYCNERTVGCIGAPDYSGIIRG